MERKLIKQGTGTLVMSLPAKWVQKHGLDKGVVVDVTENGDALLITASRQELKRGATIRLLTHTESAVRTLITNTYWAGYDRITVHFSSEQQFKTLQTVIKKFLLGFDITKKGKDFCIVENISEPSQDHRPVIIEKTLQNISLLLENTRQRLLTGGSEEHYGEIEERIQKYDNFCRRSLAKSGLSSEAVSFWFAFFTFLSHAQRELYHLNVFLDKTPMRLKSVPLLDQFISMFTVLHEAYSKKDLVRLEKLHQIEKGFIYDDIYQSFGKDKKESILSFHLGIAAKNVYFCTSPLMVLLAEQNPKQDGN